MRSVVNCKWFIRICIALPLAMCVSIANASEIKCHSKQIFKDGEERSSDLLLILEHDRVVGLSFDGIDSFVARGNPMAIWECSVDTISPDKDRQIKWSRTANRTFLEITDEEREKSLLRIEKHGNGFKVYFVHMSHYYSGMSEFPKSVVIEKDKTKCKVAY